MRERRAHRSSLAILAITAASLPGCGTSRPAEPTASAGSGHHRPAAEGTANLPGAPSVVTRWSRRFGGTGKEHGEHIAVGVNGEVFITGDVEGGFDFGAERVESRAAGRAFLAKLTAGGHPQWIRFINGEGRIRGLAAGALGAIVAGTF